MPWQNVTVLSATRKIAPDWIALMPMACAKCGKNIQRIQRLALFRGSDDELAPGINGHKPASRSRERMRSSPLSTRETTRNWNHPLANDFLHSRGGSIAESRARDRCRGSTAQSLNRARSQRAHAIAHRHSHRAVARGCRNECEGSRSGPACTASSSGRPKVF